MKISDYANQNAMYTTQNTKYTNQNTNVVLCYKTSFFSRGNFVANFRTFFAYFLQA